MNPNLLPLRKKISNRFEVLEKYSTTPLEILMDFATDPNSTRDEQITCAIAAAPYCHSKLKQVEINDTTQRRRPEEIERDITAYVERVVRDRENRRDLVGVVE
jgi:hypothetical protein